MAVVAPNVISMNQGDYRKETGMHDFDKARNLLREFKGGAYLFGAGVLCRVGEVVASLGKRPALVRDTFPGSGDCIRSCVTRRSSWWSRSSAAACRPTA